MAYNGPYAYSHGGTTRINEAVIEREKPGHVGSQTWVNFFAHEMIWINAGGNHDPIFSSGTYNEIHSGSADVAVPFHCTARIPKNFDQRFFNSKSVEN